MKALIQSKFEALKSFAAQVWKTAAGHRILFVPGSFFLLLGFSALVAPRLLIAVVAALFLFVGLILLYGALRFIELRNRAQAMYKEFHGRGFTGQVFIQTGAGPEIVVEEEEEQPQKRREGRGTKIILH